MIAPRHSIFRDKALKHYIQGNKKDVLPNFSSIPATIFVWVLLASLIATGLVAWRAQVPVYLAGSGIVLGNVNQASAGDSQAGALAFFSPDQLTHLRAGQPAQILLNAGSSQQVGTIAQVLPGVTTLAAAFKHYGLSFGGADSQSQQVAVALIALGTGFQTALYTGSTVIVEVRVGTQSMFSAISGIGNS